MKIYGSGSGSGSTTLAMEQLKQGSLHPLIKHSETDISRIRTPAACVAGTLHQRATVPRQIITNYSEYIHEDSTGLIFFRFMPLKVT